MKTVLTCTLGLSSLLLTVPIFAYLRDGKKEAPTERNKAQTDLDWFNKTTIRGLSFFGVETEHRDFMCLWSHSLDWNLAKMQELGFNSVRVPFSWQYVNESNWTVLDNFFDVVQNYNLTVVLDFHRIDNTHQSARPYTDEVSFDDFLAAWRTILKRYEWSDKLVAVSIFNEYQPSNSFEWSNLARQIISYIESRFPERFFYFVGGTNWNGNLHDIDLEDMECHNRIRYTIHKYQFSDSEPLESNWEYSFGSHKLAVVLEEWGYISSNPTQKAWAKRLVSWLISNKIFDSYFWTWTWNSGDTQGILLNDCTNIDEGKMDLLHHYWESDKGYH